MRRWPSGLRCRCHFPLLHVTRNVTHLKRHGRVRRWRVPSWLQKACPPGASDLNQPTHASAAHVVAKVPREPAFCPDRAVQLHRPNRASAWLDICMDALTANTVQHIIAKWLVTASPLEADIVASMMGQTLTQADLAKRHSVAKARLPAVSYQVRKALREHLRRHGIQALADVL